MCNSNLLTKIIYQNYEIKKTDNYDFLYYFKLCSLFMIKIINSNN